MQDKQPLTEELNRKIQAWRGFDPEIRAELDAITDPAEQEDRFYRDLEFGTGGLRGVMGAGTNRMNRYTVRRATQGLANYLLSSQKVAPHSFSVAIAYDSRLNSESFAAEAARVLCANGIRTFLFDQMAPTPVLSFAVRHLGCDAGIVITASHNPKAYNGYKVYDHEGCQLLPAMADRVISQVLAITDLASIPVQNLDQAADQGLLISVGRNLIEAFLEAVRLSSRLNPDSQPQNLKVVYTPLHGSGLIPVREILSPFNVSIVEKQAIPDGNFPTVRSPNPEEKDALAMGIEQARSLGAALVLGTDPDCDRVGVAVAHQGDFSLLTGNQIGALLVDFVTFGQIFPRGATLVKTIVTNDLGALIGISRGLSVVDTLTGFKYIGDQINQYEQSNDRTFIVGYEESFGYLAGTHARDKDAVVAARLIAEMAAFWQNQGQTLLDRLQTLYSEFGYFLDDLDAFTLQGKTGAEKIGQLMQHFRLAGMTLFEGITEVRDYLLAQQGLEPTDVLKYIFADGSWLAIRPSGTEPKIKVYYSIRAQDQNLAQHKLKMYKQIIHPLILG